MNRVFIEPTPERGKWSDALRYHLKGKHEFVMAKSTGPQCKRGVNLQTFVTRRNSDFIVFVVDESRVFDLFPLNAEIPMGSKTVGVVFATPKGPVSPEYNSLGTGKRATLKTIAAGSNVSVVHSMGELMRFITHPSE